MFRRVGTSLLIGLLASAIICGCSEQKKEAKIPDTEIPLPKEGPTPAGTAGGKAPAKGAAPAPPNQLAD